MQCCTNTSLISFYYLTFNGHFLLDKPCRSLASLHEVIKQHPMVVVIREYQIFHIDTFTQKPVGQIYTLSKSYVEIIVSMDNQHRRCPGCGNAVRSGGSRARPAKRPVIRTM